MSFQDVDFLRGRRRDRRDAQAFRPKSSNCALSVLAAAALFLWRSVHLPLLALLTVLEPVVRRILGLAMVLGALAAVVFELSAVGSRFEFLQLLVASLGFGVTLLAYYGLLALASRDSRRLN